MNIFFGGLANDCTIPSILARLWENRNKSGIA